MVSSISYRVRPGFAGMRVIYASCLWSQPFFWLAAGATSGAWRVLDKSACRVAVHLPIPQVLHSKVFLCFEVKRRAAK